MTTALPDIDFHGIRPYGQPASRSAAFEELASILIEQGVVDWPDGARFARFGNPDGGREGKGIIPNGDVWAWQAKYLFEFDSAAAGQVTSSVRRVLSLEPTLKRYFIALPLDMPAGDTADRTSAYTRWTEKVSDWEAMARENGLEVEFAFVGAHDLITALTEPQHASRARYWFGTEVLSPEWQGRRLEEVIAKAGRRYTPRLHVEIETVQALNGVGRVDAYVARWQTVLAELRQVRQWGWRAPPTWRTRLPKHFLRVKRHSMKLMPHLHSSLVPRGRLWSSHGLRTRSKLPPRRPIGWTICCISIP